LGWTDGQTDVEPAADSLSSVAVSDDGFVVAVVETLWVDGAMIVAFGVAMIEAFWRRFALDVVPALHCTIVAFGAIVPLASC